MHIILEPANPRIKIHLILTQLGHNLITTVRPPPDDNQNSQPTPINDPTGSLDAITRPGRPKAHPKEHPHNGLTGRRHQHLAG